MNSSPLKKKFNYALSTSRGNRISYHETMNTTSKSPFKGQTDHLIKCTQLEQELHRVTRQRKLISLELSDLSNQYVKKCKQLEETEQMNLLLQEKLQASRHTEEIAKLHQLLKQKNQIILEWTNRFRSLEQQLEIEHNNEAKIKQQQIQYELQKEQILELKLQLKILQENYKDLRTEKNQLNQKYIDSQVEIEKGNLRDSKLKNLEIEKESLIKELDNVKSQIGTSLVRQKQDETQKDKEKQELQKLKHIISDLQGQLREEKQRVDIIKDKKDKWKERFRKCQQEIKFETPQQKCQHEDLVEDQQDKIQQLEVENQYLREQIMEMQIEVQNVTDRMLKQQLQSSYTKEQQSQQFSFQEQRRQANEDNKIINQEDIE